MPGVLLCCWARQALIGPPWVGSYSIVQEHQCLMGQPLHCSAASAGVRGKESVVMAPPSTCESAYRLACMAAQLSSTRISHHSHLPHTPSVCLSAVNSSSFLGTAPQSPTLQLPASAPSRGSMSLSGVCMAVARTA